MEFDSSSIERRSAALRKIKATLGGEPVESVLFAALHVMDIARLEQLAAVSDPGIALAAVTGYKMLALGLLRICMYCSTEYVTPHHRRAFPRRMGYVD
jgi:hypothetical protein